jgi:NUMOD4 motif/HNH endonuclease
MGEREETWRVYPGFAGFYEVSDRGNVASLARTTTSGGLLKPHISAWGYRIVTLSRYGEHTDRRVARMVLEAFVSPCPPGHEACHGPGGKLDDRLDNLSWGTRSKNQGADRLRDGTSNRGARCGAAKLTAEIVISCRQRFAAGETQVNLATEFNVDQSVISDAVRGVSWKDLDEPPVLLPLNSRQSKMTKEIVWECRRRHGAGETITALAREFGISRSAVSMAVSGKRWRGI